LASASSKDRGTFWQRWRPRVAACTAFAAVAYLVLLIAVALSLRFIGEGWWITALALYLPRFPFALPLPILIAALLLVGPRRLLWTQVVAGLVVLFPLMGFEVSWTSRRDDAPVLRVLSQNVNSGLGDYERVAREIAAHSPDIVLLQEIFIDPHELATIMRRNYAHVEQQGQFLIASRFPIVSTVTPERVEYFGRDRTLRSLFHVVDTPLGKLAVYNVHPISPRGAFYELRGSAGLKHAILSGEFWRGQGKKDLMETVGLIAVQIGGMAEHARREPHPVIIGGDFNLPTLSTTRHRHLGDFQDGFDEAGAGFGYTYPNRAGRLRLWMRLDRIFASKELDFVSFEVGCTTTSDHLCVVAELQRK
jgi:endonuclease/exonuclease/phosphatase (EEP) superfamily protein YafD